VILAQSLIKPPTKTGGADSGEALLRVNTVPVICDDETQLPFFNGTNSKPLSNSCGLLFFIYSFPANYLKLTIGWHCWSSGESTGLSPLWPRFDPCISRGYRELNLFNVLISYMLRRYYSESTICKDE